MNAENKVPRRRLPFWRTVIDAYVVTYNNLGYLARISLTQGRLAPAALATRVRLPGRVVVSTACRTGTDAWGQVFLAGGVSAYVAPDGYPEGADVPLFLHHLFHQLIAHKAPIETAWRHAAAYDAAARLFVLHTPETTLRLPP